MDKLTVHVESSIEDYIFNYVNELKSYLDIKTDSTIMNQKLDNIQSELNNTVDDMLSTMNKFLEQRKRDKYIEDWWKENNIIFVEIPYTWSDDKIINKLKEIVG